MDELVYWIWLQQALKYGSNKVAFIESEFGSIINFYNAGEINWRLCGRFTNREIIALKSFTLGQAAAILDKCLKLGYEVMTLSSANYPHRLKQISNPPCVLYIRGDASCLNNNMVLSIVGTRKASKYGLEMAKDISVGLARRGVVVVSGGALGIDAAAHSGAMSAGGKTVAILGCGVDYPYLMKNAELRENIVSSGALVSEYPPGYPAYTPNFPIRNRIISGLSLGTVIIEAGEKSGSLITANLANDQNRDVFVIPVDMRTGSCKGTVNLIRDGAGVVTSAEDILKEYTIYTDDKSTAANQAVPDIPAVKTNKNFLKLVSKNDEILKDASEYARQVYLTLKDRKMHVDEICVLTKIPINLLLATITELELLEIIKANPGRIYEIIEKY